MCLSSSLFLFFVSVFFPPSFTLALVSQPRLFSCHTWVCRILKGHDSWTGKELMLKSKTEYRDESFNRMFSEWLFIVCFRSATNLSLPLRVSFFFLHFLISIPLMWMYFAMSLWDEFKLAHNCWRKRKWYFLRSYTTATLAAVNTGWNFQLHKGRSGVWCWLHLPTAAS